MVGSSVLLRFINLCTSAQFKSSDPFAWAATRMGSRYEPNSDLALLRNQHLNQRYGGARKILYHY